MKSPFCKVCFDTGKPESLYNSHYVNDVPGKKGVVICPTLLALECRYCKKTGHTVSRCPAITNTRKVEFARQRHERQVAFQARAESNTKTQTHHPTTNNRFAALDSSSSTAEAVAVPKVVTTSYATVLAATPAPPPPPPPPAVVVCAFQPRSPSTSPPPRLSWTDHMDSDSDDGSLCDDDDDESE